MAYYQMPGRIGCWGHSEVCWTHIWSLLFGWALISLPNSVQSWLPVAALDNAALLAGLSPVGAGLYSLGISRPRIMWYEAALKRHMYLVVVHGAAAEVSRARAILIEKRRHPAAGSSLCATNE